MNIYFKLLLLLIIIKINNPVSNAQVTNHGCYINVSANCYVNNTGSFRTDTGGVTLNYGTVQLDSNFINNNKFVSENNSNVVLRGGIQAIQGSRPTNFYNLEISGTNNKTLETDASISNNLLFTSNNILLGNNDLTLHNSATVTGASSSSFIVTNGSGSLITQALPVSQINEIHIGDTLGNYTPVTLNYAGVADTFAFKVNGHITLPDINIQSCVKNTYFINKYSASPVNAKLGLSWNTKSEGTKFNRDGTIIEQYINNVLATESQMDTASSNNPVNDWIYYALNITNFSSNADQFVVSSSNYIPVWVKAGQDTTICKGNSIIIKASMGDGEAPYKIKWTPDIDIDNPEILNPKVNPTITTTYKITVTDTLGLSASDSILVRVNPYPVITFITSPKVKCSRDSALYKVIVNNQFQTPNYQWSKNGSKITNATNSIYIISVVEQPNDGTYSCLVSNICGITSASTLLVVNTEPFIADTIPSQSICEGSNVNFAINATGTNLSYQWTENGNNISGATNTIYALSNLTQGNAGVYSCLAGNNCGEKILNPFELNVIQKPVLNISPVSINKNGGDSLAYNVSPSGTSPFTYQWLQNNNIIAGATTYDFNKASIVCSDAGVYSSVISNACGITTSGVFTLIVNNCTGDSIKGKVTYDNAAETAIANTVVYLENSEGEKLDSTITNNSGSYLFSNISNGIYNLAGGKSKMTFGGCNPVDALLVNRYYVGLISSFCTGQTNCIESLRLLAANVANAGNGKITPIDALLINRRYIDLITKFSIADWLYNPTTVTVNGSTIIQNISANCAGDVNGSYPH